MENKTPTETFPKFPSILRVIDMSDRNPPITATSVTFSPSLRQRKLDGNFGNVSAGVLFSKVAYQPGLLILRDGAISHNRPQIASDRTIHEKSHNSEKIAHYSQNQP